MLNSNYNIRKNAQASLKKLHMEEANKLILPLINTFTTTLEALNLFENTESLSRKEETNGNSELNQRALDSHLLKDYVSSSTVCLHSITYQMMHCELFR